VSKICPVFLLAPTSPSQRKLGVRVLPPVALRFYFIMKTLLRPTVGHKERHITVVVNDEEFSQWLELQAVLYGYEVLYKYIKTEGHGALWFNADTVAVIENDRIVGIVGRDFVVNFQKRIICTQGSCTPAKYGFFPSLSIHTRLDGRGRF